MEGNNEEAKNTETVKAPKEEKKEEKEVKEKKRNSQHSDATPKTSSKPVRSAHPSKKSDKVSKESLSKERILDPLDLLEPVYEEVTKESPPVKMKEVKSVPMKKGKLKKRKFSEEREESPPPLFLARKGTRSRPNVKIPKYYHTHYEPVSESTIVREPHTDQHDPLMQLEEIKAEPLDLDDDVIEIEDNVIGFPDVAVIPPHDEEIIGNYDSPLVNPDNDKTGKEEDDSAFKKISLVAQPIIMSVHSIAEKSNTVQIIDLAQLKSTTEALDKSDDPLATTSDSEHGKIADDPLNLVAETAVKGAESITITNVQTVTEIEESVEKSDDLNVEQGDGIKDIIEIGFSEEEEKEQKVVFGQEQSQSDTKCKFLIEKVVSEKEDAEMDKDEAAVPKLGSKIELKSTTLKMDTHNELEAAIDEVNLEGKEEVEIFPQGESETDVTCEFRIEKVVSEKEDVEMETDEPTIEKLDRQTELESTTLTVVPQTGFETTNDEVNTEKEEQVELTSQEQLQNDLSCEFRIEKVISEKEDTEMETDETTVEKIDWQTELESTTSKMDTQNEFEATNDERNDEKEEQVEFLPPAQSGNDASSEFCIEKVVREKEDVEMETDVETAVEKLDLQTDFEFTTPKIDSLELEATTAEAEDVPVSEIPENVTEDELVLEAETSSQVANSTNENEIANTESDKEVLVNDSEETNPEEHPVELGFHIAKVASEQFLSNDKEILKVEDCASELGFQITNVVSGQIDDSDQKVVDSANGAGTSDAGTFSNHLPESAGDVNEQRVSADALCEETQILAESLEKLLDK